MRGPVLHPHSLSCDESSLHSLGDCWICIEEYTLVHCTCVYVHDCSITWLSCDNMDVHFYHVFLPRAYWAAEGSGGSISPCFYLMMNVLSMTGQVLMYLACSNSQSLKHWAANNNILIALSLLKSFSALKSLGGREGQYWTVQLCELLVSSPGSPIIFQSTRALKKAEPHISVLYAEKLFIMQHWVKHTTSYFLLPNRLNSPVWSCCDPLEVMTAGYQAVSMATANAYHSRMTHYVLMCMCVCTCVHGIGLHDMF